MAVFMAITPSRWMISGELLIPCGRSTILSRKKSNLRQKCSCPSGERDMAVALA